MAFGAWGLRLAAIEMDRKQPAPAYSHSFPLEQLLNSREYSRFRSWLNGMRVGVGYVNPDPAVPQIQLAVGKPSYIAPRRAGQDILFSFEGQAAMFLAGSSFTSDRIEVPQESAVYANKLRFVQEIRRLEPLVNSGRVAREPYEAFVRKVEESRFPYP